MSLLNVPAGPSVSYATILNATRQTFERLGNALTGHVCTVTVTATAGETAGVQWTHDTQAGTADIELHFPTLPPHAMLPRGDADRMVALLVHELLHVYATNNVAWREVVAENNPALAQLVNALEDARIEALAIREAKIPAARDLFSRLNSHFLAIALGRGFKVGSLAQLPYGLAILARVRTGQTIEGADRVKVAPAMRAAVAMGVAGIRRCNHTPAVISLARQILATAQQGQQGDQPGQQGDQPGQPSDQPGQPGDQPGQGQPGQGQPGDQGDQQGQDGPQGDQQGAQGQQGAQQGQDGQGDAQGAQDGQQGQGDAQGAPEGQGDAQGAQQGQQGDQPGQGQQGQGDAPGQGQGDQGDQQGQDGQGNQGTAGAGDDPTGDALADITRRARKRAGDAIDPNEGDYERAKRQQIGDQLSQWRGIPVKPGRLKDGDVTRPDAVHAAKGAVANPGPAKATLRRLLRAPEAIATEHRLTQGRLDRRALARIPTGAKDVFSRRVETDAANVGVILIVDRSVSMRDGERMPMARSLALHFGEACEQAGAASMVTTFIDPGGVSTMGRRGMHPSVALMVLKGWHERIANPVVAARVACMQATGGTPLSPCIMQAADMLAAKRDLSRRVVLALTDGECYLKAEGVRWACSYAASRGAETIGIVLESTDEIGFAPAQTVRVANAADLTSLALRALAKALAR